MRIPVNEIQLNYVERGLPTGLPVVFIHGFPFSHEMWEPQMRSLPNNIRAISYDIRGHGASDLADGYYTIELFVDDLIALLDHLVIDRAVLCGLSMGGYIALRAVERHPNRVRGLILCDTKSEADTDEGKVNRAARLRQIQTAGVGAFAQEFVKTIFAAETFQTRHEAIELIKRLINANDPRGICGALMALGARTDTTAALASITVPTLVLGGELDALTPPATMRALHERIAGSGLRLFAGAGHMSNLEQPELFNEALEEFLRQLA